MGLPRTGRRHALVALAIGAAAAVACVSGAAGGAPAATAWHTPTLPRLGPITTVDSNDVGDPFVVAVPAGVATPAGVPYQVSGPDAYVSAPWTARTAASARARGWYALFGTTDWQSNIPTAISPDLTQWSQAPDALPRLPAWAAPSISMTWAPSVVHLGRSWIMYFSTEEAASKLECIGRAVAAAPTGPYVPDAGGPLACQRAQGGSIDPSVVDAGPVRYLVWKSDGNSSGLRTAVWAQRLSPDGSQLLGTPSELIASGQAWEHGVVEAPAMVPAGAGGYWLFYSGGAWNSPSYGTGLAYCRSVTGPCRPTADRPFLATTTAVTSPGGLDTFTDLSGRMWVAFTALKLVPAPWDPGRSYYNRVLDIAPVLSR